ncbi:hypothetical protein CUT44_18695 [Streptomyces carminius]|uniref:Integral membrane protein n=1 Tax=Streptomyces carminius TaxID=2665496 RepID=A0A2M8LXD2_9ACTN|nr:hypothetical protein CUT44_18695 [Streptomyces carminius]
MGVNLLLGVPAVVPVWLLWQFAANWPLAALGWTRGEPTENDGMLPWFLFAGPVVVAFALVWWLVNRAVARRARLRGGPYWAVAAVTVLVPSLASVAVTALL